VVWAPLLCQWCMILLPTHCQCHVLCRIGPAPGPGLGAPAPYSSQVCLNLYTRLGTSTSRRLGPEGSVRVMELPATRSRHPRRRRHHHGIIVMMIFRLRLESESESTQSR
jgi:hypothetical protein